MTCFPKHPFRHLSTQAWNVTLSSPRPKIPISCQQSVLAPAWTRHIRHPALSLRKPKQKRKLSRPHDAAAAPLDQERKKCISAILQRAPLRSRILWWSQLYRTNQVVHIASTVDHAQKDERAILNLTNHMSHPKLVWRVSLRLFVQGDDRAYAKPVPSKLLVDIGMHLYRGILPEKTVSPERDLGLLMWAVATALGDVDAERLLFKHHYLEGQDFPPWLQVGLEVMTDLVEKREDWTAMAYYAQWLREMGQNDDALEMSRELCRATSPGPVIVTQAEATKTLEVPAPVPWRTWAFMSDPEDAQERQQAWEYGAVVWDDPEACALHVLSEKVTVGTEHWVKYVTKAAMAGHTRSMQDLGKYYLAVHGWYPHDPQARKAPYSEIGFHWLQLSTVLEPPLHEANVWAGLATVLRDAGDSERARDLLREGRGRVKEKCDSSNVSFDDKVNALTRLDSVEAAWRGTRMIHKTSADSQHAADVEHAVDVERFLGKPIMPVWS